uniref:Uncharacterized protein n=1 Tax=Crocodylus porosus TaxID=8502 RepID=A0A7M4FVD1_CROPO
PQKTDLKDGRLELPPRRIHGAPHWSRYLAAGEQWQLTWPSAAAANLPNPKTCIGSWGRATSPLPRRAGSSPLPCGMALGWGCITPPPSPHGAGLPLPLHAAG